MKKCYYNTYASNFIQKKHLGKLKENYENKIFNNLTITIY